MLTTSNDTWAQTIYQLQHGQTEKALHLAIDALVQGHLQAFDLTTHLLSRFGISRPLEWLKANVAIPEALWAFYLSQEEIKSPGMSMSRYLSLLAESAASEPGALVVASLQQDFNIDVSAKDAIKDIAAQLESKPTPAIPYADPKHLHQTFSSELCRFICRQLEPTVQPSLVVDPHTGKSSPNTHRKCYFSPWLINEMGLLGMLTELKWTTIKGGMGFGEPINLLLYPTGGEYKAHLDSFSAASLTPQRPQRTQTLLMGLMPEGSFSGGATRFELLNQDMVLHSGDLLIFDNVQQDGTPKENSLHRGMPVASGTKAILSKWYTKMPTPYDQQKEALKQKLMNSIKS